MRYEPGDRITVTKEGHTFQGKSGTIRMVEPDIRALLFTADLLHIEMDSGHSIRAFSVFTVKLGKEKP